MFKEHLAHMVGGVVDLSAEGELDAALGKEVADVAGVGHRSCEAVELRYDEGVALTHRGQGLDPDWAVSGWCR